MKIWTAGICNIKGCTRYRSLLRHGDKLVGNHAHCCCMCRRTNGKEHAYYCREDGHYYLKDDGQAYSQVFVKDTGKAAADAAWYAASWDNRSWGSQSWGESWSETASVPEIAAEGDATKKAEADDVEHEIIPEEGDEDAAEEELVPEEEAEDALSGAESFSSNESVWPPRTAM